MSELGAGRCHICGERAAARHAFLVQVKNVGTGAARTSAVLNVLGGHCEACSKHFDAFRARRLQAIAMLVLCVLLFAPLLALGEMLAGRAGPVMALGVIGVLGVIAFVRMATWHDALREEVGPELLDELARGLPEVPGALQWSEVRFFPSVPSGVEVHHTLDAVRERGARARRLPN